MIAEVSKPRACVSFMVIVTKKKGKLRICLDPRYLNSVIQRERYLVLTIEDVTTRLHGAKLFTKLDDGNVFWHVTLEEASYFLTIFHTSFGRYRSQRLLFWIISAPEVFQRKIHELTEGQ